MPTQKRKGALAAELKTRGWRKKTFLFPAAIAHKLAHRAVEEERPEKAIVMDAIDLYFEALRARGKG